MGQTLKSNVTGYVGEDVLLSCNCSNDPKELVWQKGDRVVNAHSQDKIIIDESYVNRTQLFINMEKRNCSLLLLKISKTDAGLYTCHALFSVENNIWSRKPTDVNLTGEFSNYEFIYPSRSIVNILKGNSKPLPVLHFQCASLFKVQLCLAVVY